MNITPENLKFIGEFFKARGITKGLTQVQQVVLMVELLAENSLLVEADDDEDGSKMKATKAKAAAVLYALANASAARQKFESLKMLEKSETAGKTAESLASKFTSAFE